MKLKALKGFKSLETHHCVTGSMRHIYVYNDHPLNELAALEEAAWTRLRERVE